MLQHHAAQQNTLLGNKRQLQQAAGLLEKHISQSKHIAVSADLGEVIRSTENLKRATEITARDCDLFGQIKNCSSSSLRTEPSAFDESLCNIGKACLQSLLPTSVKFGCNDITAGLRTNIELQLFDDAGNRVPFAASFLTVLITDPHQKELPVTINTTNPECTVAFTPRRSGQREISIMYLGQKLQSEQTHITVNSNDPVLKFGGCGSGKGTFKYPRGIELGKDNCLYVADAGNRLIQKFTADGEFLSQFHVNVNGPNYSTFDMVVDENKGLVTCTEILIGEEGTTYEKSLEGDKVLVFNLEGELQREYKNDTMKLPEYITMNNPGDMIISDRNTNSLFKYDEDGVFISELRSSGILNRPTYMCILADNIVVSDTANNCIRICDSAGKYMQQIGCEGEETGRLKHPFGVATDGEYILVADGGNSRIQVFKPDGTFVSMIESESDPLSNPRGLAVTRDGFVYVADRDHHCIKKYKYKSMSNW